MIINNLEFTFGADPEFFVQKNGRPVSAHGLIPGDKKNPHKVGWGAVQVDGMALEFNIDPAKGEAGFLRNLQEVMNTILRMVPEHQMYDHPVADFDADYMRQQPEEAVELGCEPDFNAYTMDINPRPNVDAPFRTASGHIHIGWTKGVDPHDPGHFQACATLAKMLDVYIGIPSLLWDGDDRRRELYGKAGAFRPKPYGMEYRTLSNRWLRRDLPHLRKFIFNNTADAVKMCFKNPDLPQTDFMGKGAKSIIDEGDRQAAMSFLKYIAPQHNIKAPSDYRAAV